MNLSGPVRSAEDVNYESKEHSVYDDADAKNDEGNEDGESVLLTHLSCPRKLLKIEKDRCLCK